MIHYRKANEEDRSQILHLVNQVFQPIQPMEKSFPLLFNEYNLGYVGMMEEENQPATLVAFIGVFPEELCAANQSFWGCRLGAVCVAQQYQGQGIGTQLFQFVQNELKASGAEYLLISGQGKVYLNGGAERFGCFYHHVFERSAVKHGAEEIAQSIAEPEEYAETVTIQELSVGFETSCLFQRLQRSEPTYYVRSAFELQTLLKAQSLVHLNGGTPLLLSAEKNGRQAILTAALSTTPKRSGQIIECWGAVDLLPALIRHLLQYTEEVHLWHKDRLLKEQGQVVSIGQKEENAGSIVYLNQTLRGIVFPHTWDLGFV